MTKEIKNKQIVKNISLSLLAQLVSLSVSFLLNIIVPKFIDEYQYAYWHTFLLYLSYVGVLHFGLLDGLVLRYAQYDYEELDKQKIRSQFIALLTINSVAWLFLTIYGIASGGFTKIIAVLVACGIFTKNIFTYNSYLFQITNRIHKYAFVIIAQRFIYGIIVLLLIVFNQQCFILYCIADLIGDCAGIIISILSNKDLHFGKLMTPKDIFAEFKLNITAGILLMIANWSSLLLISGAKMMIEWKWGTLIFGKTSFAFSVSHLLLTFITAISVVLFPSLKRMKQDLLPTFYKTLRDMIIPFLFWGLLLYYPECWILNLWLPKYTSSLTYLGLLSPIIIYMSIISLLTNNYLKAYRQEKFLLIINIQCVMLAIFLYVISAFVLNNIKLMLLTIVIVIMLRSIMSELYVMRLIHIKLYRDFFIECIMTSAFLFSSQCFSIIGGFIFYFIFLIIYSYFKRNNLKALFLQILILLRRAKTY